MRRLLCLVIFFAGGQICQGASPDIFGYFEPQLMGAYLQNETILLSSNKLRMDFESHLAEGVKCGANINFFNYNGTTRYNALDYLPDAVVEQVPPGMETYYEFAYQDSFALDNAYIRLSFKAFDLTVGKQQISYGTGYAWNPTDIFNRKDILDPTYEQPGHNAVRLDVPLGQRSSVMGIYAPAERWNRPTVLVRWKTQVSRFDVSLSMLTTDWETVDYTTFTSFRQTRRLIGGDLAGQLFGLGIWAEGAYNAMDVTDDFWEAAAGFDYTLRNGLYVLGELYHNSLAPASKDDYTLNDWMHYFTGASNTIGQTQGYVFLQYPLTDLLSLGGSVIGCLSDASTALVPQLDYSLFQDVDLTAFGYLYLGQEGTMYAASLGNGGLIRLRVYF